MTYAMILLNSVIGVLESDTPPSWPPDPQGNPVTTVECGEDIELGMIGEDIELGMIYDTESGTFSEYIPPAYIPTQLDRIESRLNLSYTEAQNQAVDAYTKELIEGGII